MQQARSSLIIGRRDNPIERLNRVPLQGFMIAKGEETLGDMFDRQSERVEEGSKRRRALPGLQLVRHSRADGREAT